MTYMVTGFCGENTLKANTRKSLNSMLHWHLGRIGFSVVFSIFVQVWIQPVMQKLVFLPNIHA